MKQEIKKWKTYSFDELFDFDGGMGIPRDQLGDVGIPYLHYGDMHTSSKDFIDLDSEIGKKLPRYDIQASGKSQLNDGDLVFVDASEDYEGTCRTFLIKNVSNQPFISGLHTFVAREKNKVVSNDFKKYITRIPQVKSQIFKFVQGYKVYGINRNNLKLMDVMLPEFDESQKIANVLTTWDNAVELQEKKIGKLQEKKKALMQKLLTPKPDWKEAKLEKLEEEKIIQLYRGNVISKDDIKLFPGDYPIYSSSVINNGTMGFYGKYMFDEELITWSIDGGGNFFYRPKHKFSVTNVSGYMRIKKQNMLNYKFLSEQLQYLHQKYKFDYLVKAHPSVIRKLYTIYYPTIDTQNKISNIAISFDKKLELERQLLEKYKEQRKALMQLLLTGIVRV